MDDFEQLQGKNKLNKEKDEGDEAKKVYTSNGTSEEMRNLRFEVNQIKSEMNVQKAIFNQNEL